MALGWLTILRSVPWSDVISNAPKVAEGAKKLWNTVGKKSPPAEDPQAGTRIDAPPEARTMAALEARSAALEAAVSDLHGQMLASSELIKALAEQNAQLVKGIEANRVRVMWLTATTAVAAAAALLSLILAFSR